MGVADWQNPARVNLEANPVLSLFRAVLLIFDHHFLGFWVALYPFPLLFLNCADCTVLSCCHVCLVTKEREAKVIRFQLRRHKTRPSPKIFSFLGRDMGKHFDMFISGNKASETEFT